MVAISIAVFFFYVLVGHEKITMERKFKLSHVVFLL